MHINIAGKPNRGVVMESNEYHQPNKYRIWVKETLDCNFGDWISDLTLVPQKNGETVLISTFADQPALRGFIDQLWNLNITVISVERIENDT
jgi:hypothetical protein